MKEQLKDFFEYKILIIDDLTSMRENLKTILSDLGFSFFDESIDGKQALALALDKARFHIPYDIIFIDIYMPVMDGVTLLKNLRRTDSYSNTPIFMVSTANEKSIIINSILYGATDYILKPYNLELVSRKLISVLTK